MPAKIECMTYPKKPRKRRARNIIQNPRESRFSLKRNFVEGASRKTKQSQRTGRQNSAPHSARNAYR